MSYVAYNKYKEVDTEAIPKIPSHWVVGKVKYVTKNLDYKRIPLSAEERGSRQGEYPYYGASGIIDYINDYIFNQDYILCGEDGHNLFARVTPFAFIARGKYWVNNHAHILNPIDRCNEYWVMSLASIDITPVISGSAQPKLTAEALGNLNIVYPLCIYERRQIANFLDQKTTKIDTLIEKQQQLIKLLQEKRQAVISHAVTKGLNPDVKMKDSGVEWIGEIPASWNMWRIAHICPNIASGTTPKTDNEIHYGGKNLWITTGELRENIITDTQKYVTDQALVDIPALRVHPTGSVAIAMYGATIGRLGILGKDAATNQACCVINPSKALNNKYLFYWLYATRQEIINFSSGGSQPNVNREKIASLKVSVPKLKEQTQIVNFLDHETAKIDTLIEKQQQLIKLLQERRTALISAAVTGKIDVKDATP